MNSKRTIIHMQNRFDIFKCSYEMFSDVVCLFPNSKEQLSKANEPERGHMNNWGTSQE